MYLDLAAGNQHELIIKPDKDNAWIDSTIKQFPWASYEMEEHRLSAYMEHLFDVLPEKAEDYDEEGFWEALSLGQKIFYAYLVFEGEVDEGGIFQFFWNREEHAYTVQKVIEVLKLDTLKKEYHSSLKKYKSISEKLHKLKEQLDENDPNWEKKSFKAYEKGLDLFEIEENNLDEFFYDEGFKKEFHKAMCDYIEENRKLFVV